MTGQAKQLQGVVVRDQGRQRLAVVVVTHSAPMVVVVRPVVVVVHPAPTVDVVVHSAQTVVVVVHSATVIVAVHSADESEDNPPFQGVPPNSHMDPAQAGTC